MSILLGLPENSGGGNDVVELRVEGIAVLNTAITGCSSIYHHHHCSTHWRRRGCECLSSAVDAGSLDTGSTVGIINNNLETMHNGILQMQTRDNYSSCCCEIFGRQLGPKYTSKQPHSYCYIS